MKHFSERNFWLSKAKNFFSEILFQKKPPHASLVLLFQLCNREEVICINENVFCSEM